MKNKGMSKQQQPDSGIHDAFCSLSMCVASFNFLGHRVSEKSNEKFKCLKTGEKEK